MEIGEPIKRWEVVPLSEPIPNTPDPGPPVPAAPAHAPEKEKEDA